MAQSTEGGTLASIYEHRIGDATNSNEVTGYWVFALGALIGIVGFGLFIPSESATGLRELSIAVGAIGLPLMFAGPVLRLPLDRRATTLVTVGIATCFVAVAWFVTVFPSGWNLSTGNQNVMGLYAVGLAAITAGGIFVPMLSPVRRDEGESDRNAALVEERDDALADEADLARELEASRADADAAAAAAEQPESQASFEIYEDGEGKWRWRLRHRNGNVLADSGQGYSRRIDAQNGMESVRRDAFGAAAIAITPDEESEDAGGDDAAASGVTVADAGDSKATFEIYEDAGGEQWRWRLLHDNGNIIADGSEGYDSKSNVQRAMDEIRGHVAAANYLHVDPVAYELYEDDEGQWRWRLIHENGNVLASAARGYDARPDAREAVAAVKETLADAEVTER